jgi:hypothetical protein
MFVLSLAKREGPCRRRTACEAKLVISDAHEGLKAAIAQIFKAS